MMKILPVAALISALLLAGAAPADARTCRNSHGRVFHCHRIFKPRINFHKHHPVKVMRCRGDHGKLNNC